MTLAERQAQLFVEDDDQRDELGTEFSGGGAQRVRGLPGMPPLHASMAIIALRDVHGELAHNHAARRLQRAFQLIDPPLHRSCSR